MALRRKIVFLPYDFDSAIGIDNYGRLVFSYELEDIDHPNNDVVYAGQNSVLWKNVRAGFHQELTAMYKSLRSGNNPVLSYQNIEQMFEDHQSVWSEALFNEDSYYKYILPLIEENEDRLVMCLGSKAEQRKWWLYNRFKYIDSKYNAGDASADSVSMRSYYTPSQGETFGITVTPYADIYATIMYGVAPSSVRATRNNAVLVPCPLDHMEFTDTYIYSASQIKSFGDLSIFKPDAVEFSRATHIQELKFGDSDSNYSNPNLRSLHLGNNILLKKLDVRNCPNLATSVDLSGCVNIEEVYFDGTAITGLDLANGALVKKLHLPATMTNLTLLNLSQLTEFVCPSYSNVTTLRVENCSNVIDPLDILDDIQANSRVRIIGFDITVSQTSDIDTFYNKLGTMRGISENGIDISIADGGARMSVSGTIHINAMTGADKARLEALCPYITIDAAHTTSVRYYKTWDGSSTVGTVTCQDGVPQASAPSVPSRSSTAQYTFTAVGWSSNQDAQTANYNHNTVTMSDMTYYAAYSRTVRSYTITFVRAAADGGGTLQTRTIAYGTMASYTGSTPTTTQGNATDYPFLGWEPTLAKVTGAVTYTAVFGSPVEDVEISDSWDTIIQHIDAGDYATRYSVGNYKPLDLGTEGIVNMQIVAFDTDEFANNTNKVAITFVAKNCLATTRRIANTSTSVWENCELRTVLNNTIKPMIPSNVRNRILSVKKYSRTHPDQSGVNNALTTDSIWIPSLRELCQSDCETTGPEYDDIFVKNTFRIKTLNGSAIRYWTRSSRAMSAFNCVGTDGYFTNSISTLSTVGVCIGFCLGREQETITDSWSTILSRSNPSQYYSVGDTKELDLGTEGKHLMQIVGFGVDDKADNSGKAKITWISRDCLNTRKEFMNIGSSFPENGYGASDLRTYMINTIKPKIQSDVRNAIVSVKKYTNTKTTSNVLSTEDVWIPSAFEVGVNKESSGVSYSSVFSYSTSRLKKFNGEYGRWWLRTMHNGYYASIVEPNGDVSISTSATDVNGVVLGFCTDQYQTITDSWETILSRSDPSQYYSIGDTKEIDLGSEGKHLMEIVAFNADDKADGTGKAKITWISKDLLDTKKSHANGDSATSYSWETSLIRTWLQNTVESLIPSAVMNSIVSVTKISNSVTNAVSSTNGTSTSDKLWIPSARELGSASYETSGATYTTKFTNDSSRIKKYHGEVIAHETIYKTRSGYMYGNNAATAVVYSSGYIQNQTSNCLLGHSSYIALGFCTD